MPKECPGTAQQQALLKAIVSYYVGDPRVIAVVLFGSLARGTWGRFSDLDLDVIVEDDIVIDIPGELEHLCATLALSGEPTALIVPTSDDAGDVVLESLLQFSIRYHPLCATSPNIVDNLQVLTGSLSREEIQEAGRANWRPKKPLQQSVDAMVRWALGVEITLQRQNLWLAVELLHQMRTTAMELFAKTHGGRRHYYTFEEQASPSMQVRLSATLPQYDSQSIRESLGIFLDLLERDLGPLTGGLLSLGEPQRGVLRRVRQRLEELDRS